MAIRITQNQLAGQFTSDVNSIYTKLARSQQQVSDGRRITKPSDDPFGAAQVIEFDRQIEETQRFKANVSDSIAFMNAADAALDTITTALHQIREKTLQAQNGTNGVADRASIAQEVQQLKDVVRDGLNAQYGDSFVFGGTSSMTAPFPAPANPYVGNANQMSRRIGPNQTVNINVAGDAISGPNGSILTNVLDIIDQLVIDINAGNTAGMATGNAAIVAHTDVALNVRTSMGATVSRLETVQTRLGMTEERLLAAKSEIADVDTAEAYMKFQQHQSMYEAALAAGTRIMQTSILDFI